MLQKVQSERVQINKYIFLHQLSHLHVNINKKNTDRGVTQRCFFSQGNLFFFILFIISIKLHNLCIVSGLCVLNNDDSFNTFCISIDNNILLNNKILFIPVLVITPMFLGRRYIVHDYEITGFHCLFFL